jgi:hypothetical protein
MIHCHPEPPELRSREAMKQRRTAKDLKLPVTTWNRVATRAACGLAHAVSAQAAHLEILRRPPAAQDDKPRFQRRSCFTA